MTMAEPGGSFGHNAGHGALTGVLVGIGAVLLVIVTILIGLLSALPDRPPFLAKTLSADAYGVHGGLVRFALVLFGLASMALGIALWLRLGGAGGVACGALVGVWAGASVVDAFDRTGRTHTGTAISQSHTVLAIAGIAAQAVVALLLVGILRRRRVRVPVEVRIVTVLIAAGVLFAAAHTNAVAGLAERLLFAASGAWMLVSVRAARRGGHRTPGSA